MNSNDDQTIMIKTYDMLLLLAEILFLILKVVYYICEDIYRLIVPTKKKSVAGEIVLITGAGHGIGKELAIGYASLGATVVCWDINKETNNETMNDIKRMGRDSVYAYRCNVADREEVFRVAEKVKKEVGDVTILVNNAGAVFIKSFLNQSLDEIAQVIDVNVTAHYWASNVLDCKMLKLQDVLHDLDEHRELGFRKSLLTNKHYFQTLKAFLPNMIEKNHGHVVALSSIAGLFGAPYGTVYCPSKFAVKAIMEAMCEELRELSNGKCSINFTTVYLSFVRTGFVKKNIKIRFPRLMGELLPQKAASSIIDAQRQNYRNKSIPSFWLPISKLGRHLPDKAFECIRDFADFGAYEED